MKKTILSIFDLLILFVVLTSFNNREFCKKCLRINLYDTTKPNIYGYYFNSKSGPVKYNVYDGMHNLTIDTADTYCDFLFLYGDSTVFIYSNILKHFDLIESVIKDKYFESHNKNTFKNLGKRGYYSVKNNIVYATVYFHDPSRFHSWIKEELKFSFKESGMLLLLQTVCKQCKNQYSDYGDKDTLSFGPPEKFKFISFLNKPDSSLITFKKKK